MLTVMVRLFGRVVLITNLGNTKAMVFTPGFVWGQQGTAAYNRRATGDRGAFLDQKKIRV